MIDKSPWNSIEYESKYFYLDLDTIPPTCDFFLQVIRSDGRLPITTTSQSPPGTALVEPKSLEFPTPPFRTSYVVAQGCQQRQTT
jgi:hypothetical protein